MPIVYPYITSTVYLNLNPIIKYNDRDVIKSACNRIYCSYNKKKYDHIFYLSYDNKNNQWSKTIASIKKEGTKVHILGYYLEYSSKEDKNSSLFHAIQLTELDFESKFDKFTNNDNDDDFFLINHLQKINHLNLNQHYQHHQPHQHRQIKTKSIKFHHHLKKLNF